MPPWLIRHGRTISFGYVSPSATDTLGSDNGAPPAKPTEALAGTLELWNLGTLEPVQTGSGSKIQWFKGPSSSCSVCSSQAHSAIAQAPGSQPPRLSGTPPDGVLVLFAADTCIQVSGTIAATERYVKRLTNE